MQSASPGKPAARGPFARSAIGPGPLVFMPYRILPLPVALGRNAKSEPNVFALHALTTGLTRLLVSAVSRAIPCPRFAPSRERVPASKEGYFCSQTPAWLATGGSTGPTNDVPLGRAPTDLGGGCAGLNENLPSQRIVEIPTALAAYFAHDERRRTIGTGNFHYARLVMSQETGGAPALLSIVNVTKWLHICRRSLEREIQRGRFPRPLKVGRSSRWHESDVKAYLEMLRQERAAYVPPPPKPPSTEPEARRLREREEADARFKRMQAEADAEYERRRKLPLPLP